MSFILPPDSVPPPAPPPPPADWLKRHAGELDALGGLEAWLAAQQRRSAARDRDEERAA